MLRVFSKPRIISITVELKVALRYFRKFLFPQAQLLSHEVKLRFIIGSEPDLSCINVNSQDLSHTGTITITQRDLSLACNILKT